MDFSNIKISKFQGAASEDCVEVFMLEEVNKIKKGTYSLKVEQCRKTLADQGQARYDSEKKMLPAITFSALYSGARLAENLLGYTGMIVVDIDHIQLHQIKKIKEAILSDPYIFACWISPSGFGVKILFYTASTVILHKYYYYDIVDYVENTYDLNVDTTGKDVGRLCFVSYDDILYMNEQCKLYEIDVDNYLLQMGWQQKVTSGVPPLDLNERIDAAEKSLLYDSEGRNDRRNRIMIERVIKFLIKNQASITGNYEKWFKVALSIANTFTYDLGKKYYLQLCSIDGIYHDENKSLRMLEYCYLNRRKKGINFPTLMLYAKEKGFVIGNLPKSSNE